MFVQGSLCCAIAEFSAGGCRATLLLTLTGGSTSESESSLSFESLACSTSAKPAWQIDREKHHSSRHGRAVADACSTTLHNNVGKGCRELKPGLCLADSGMFVDQDKPVYCKSQASHFVLCSVLHVVPRTG